MIPSPKSACVPDSHPAGAPLQSQARGLRSVLRRARYCRLVPFLILGICSRSGLAQTPSCIRTEIAQARPLQGSVHDQFGIAVALSGNLAAFGSDPTYDNGLESSVEIFRLQQGVWTREAELVPGHITAFDHYGTSIAADGSVVAVGAYQSDYKGAVFVFRKDASGLWQEEQRLRASNRLPYDRFGQAVAVDGDLIVVGAPDRDGPYVHTGAAYVYRFDGTAWVEEAYLVSPDLPGNFARFGNSVAVDGDRLVVGAPSLDDVYSGPGHAYVFHFESGTWQPEAILFPGDDQENFGYSVDIEGNLIAVADYHDSYMSHVGRAYVYRRSGSDWREEQMLEPSDVEGAYRFANSVAVSGNSVVVGAVGGNGCPDDPGCNSGKAYVYRSEGGIWQEVLQLFGSVLAQNTSGSMGAAIAMEGNRVVLGAPKYGAIGDQTTGAGFFFNVRELSLAALPRAPSPGDALAVRLDGGKPGEVAFLSIRQNDGTPDRGALPAVPVGLFSSECKYELSLPVLPVHAGLQLELRGFGISALGDFASSNPEVIHVQHE